MSSPSRNRLQTTDHRPQTKIPRPDFSSKGLRSVVCGLWSERGFTLVEALVAIVILASGLVLVAEGMGRTQQAFRISEHLAAASLLGQEKMAEWEMELEQFRKLRSGTDQGREKIGDREYTWEKAVRPYRHKSIKDTTKLNQADVLFQWKEGRGRSGRLELSSLFLNREKKLSKG